MPQPSKIKAWLDDIRPLPWLLKEEGFVAFADAESLLPHVEAGEVEFIDFDHDLGYGKLTGYDLAKRIEELAADKKIEPIEFSIHSGNVIGAANIEMAMQSAWRFWDLP